MSHPLVFACCLFCLVLAFFFFFAVKHTRKMSSYRWFINYLKWSPSREQIERALVSLPLPEIEKLQKFVYADDYRASLAGKLMIGRLVNGAGVVEFSEFGKPFVRDFEFVFNVSHHGQYAVFVAERRQRTRFLGVDCMSLDYKGGKTIEEFFRLMNRNFSEHEWHQIKNGDDLPIRTFFRLWALKESYVKAIGTGVTVDLRTISFRLNSRLKSAEIVRDSQLFLNNVLQTDWHFDEQLLDSDHCTAVAFETSDYGQFQPQRFSLLTIDELLSDGELVADETRARLSKLFFEKIDKK